MERSFLIVKPDALQQRIGGNVIAALEQQIPDLSIDQLKIMQLTREHVEQHYAHLAGKEFYEALVRFMMSSPVWAMIVSGQEGIINRIRTVLGATDSRKADPNTIRGKYGNKETVMYNVAHASDSPQSAEREIRLFFPEVTRTT